MTVMMWQKQDGTSSLTTETWTDVLSKTGILNAAANFIFVSAEYGGSSSGIEVGLRILLNGNEVSFDYHRPTLANQFRKFTDFGIFEPEEEIETTLILQARALSSGQTINIRRVRLMVFQT